MIRIGFSDPVASLASAPDLLQRAWKAVRAAGGGPGIDRQPIDVFAIDSERSLRRISAEVGKGSYRFSRLRRAVVPKPGGNQRRLGIPTVADRIVLQAIRYAIEPACELQMEDCSHAYRPGRGAMSAMAQINRAIASGRTIVLESDILSFFDSIRHDALYRQLAAMEPRTKRSRLIAEALALSTGFWRTKRGVAQGSPLSPLLANVALTPFDRKLYAREWSLIRYADDIILFCGSMQIAQAAQQQMINALAELGLKLHPDKTAIVDSRRAQFRFLGFEFHPDRLWPDEANLGRFRDSVLALCNPHDRLEWPGRINQLNSMIRSFAWYYHQTDSRRLFWTLDQFVADQLEALELKIGPPPEPWRTEIVKMARMREVAWRGKRQRKVHGWDGYGG